MKRGAWSPVSVGVGVWMLWCVATVAITAFGRPFAEFRDVFSVPMVALLLAAGCLAIVGGARLSRGIATALGATAVALPLATVMSFGDRGRIGSLAVGSVLALAPIAAAWGIFRRQREVPRTLRAPALPDASRIGCALLGAGMVVVFGTPLVHSWLRGVAPYDLSALGPSTLGERFAEAVPLLLAALGVVALAAITVTNTYLPLVAAAILTCLITAAVIQVHDSSLLLTALRMVVVVGGSLLITVLVGMAARGERRVHAGSR